MSSIFDRVVFTENDAELVRLLNQIPNLSAFLDSRPHLVKFADLSGSLQFSTSALPNDGPYFIDEPVQINLNIKDGGHF